MPPLQEELPWVPDRHGQHLPSAQQPHITLEPKSLPKEVQPLNDSARTLEFIEYLLSAEGQKLLEEHDIPPVTK